MITFGFILPSSVKLLVMDKVTAGRTYLNSINLIPGKENELQDVTGSRMGLGRTKTAARSESRRNITGICSILPSLLLYSTLLRGISSVWFWLLLWSCFMHLLQARYWAVLVIHPYITRLCWPQFHNIYTVRHRLHAITHGACVLYIYIYIYIYANMVQLIWVLCSHATESRVEQSLASMYCRSAVRFLSCLIIFLEFCSV